MYDSKSRSRVNEEKYNKFKKDIQNERMFLFKINQFFNDEFDELFDDILILDENQFFTQLQSRVENELEGIYSDKIFTDKKFANVLIKGLNNIKSDYKSNYDLLNSAYEIYLKSKNSRKNDIEFLNNQYRRHCMGEVDNEHANHFCNARLGKFILVRKHGSVHYVICSNCKKVYYSNMITCKCYKCNKEYYTEILSKYDNEFLLPATWENYHCKQIANEKIKCIKCHETFYLNMKTGMLVCQNKNCNFTSKPSRILWTCSICQEDFKSGAIPYNPLDLEIIKKLIKQTLFQKQKAHPNKVPCCKLNVFFTEFYHKRKCPGILYTGELNDDIIIVCDKCHAINFNDRFIWTCPKCGSKFKDENNDKESVSEDTDNTANSYKTISTEGRRKKNDSYLTDKDSNLDDDNSTHSNNSKKKVSSFAPNKTSYVSNRKRNNNSIEYKKDSYNSREKKEEINSVKNYSTIEQPRSFKVYSSRFNRRIQNNLNNQNNQNDNVNKTEKELKTEANDNQKENEEEEEEVGYRRQRLRFYTEFNANNRMNPNNRRNERVKEKEKEKEKSKESEEEDDQKKKIEKATFNVFAKYRQRRRMEDKEREERDKKEKEEREERERKKREEREERERERERKIKEEREERERQKERERKEKEVKLRREKEEREREEREREKEREREEKDDNIYPKSSKRLLHYQKFKRNMDNIDKSVESNSSKLLPKSEKRGKKSEPKNIIKTELVEEPKLEEEEEVEEEDPKDKNRNKNSIKTEETQNDNKKEDIPFRERWKFRRPEGKKTLGKIIKEETASTSHSNNNNTDKINNNSNEENSNTNTHENNSHKSNNNQNNNVNAPVQKIPGMSENLLNHLNRRINSIISKCTIPLMNVEDYILYKKMGEGSYGVIFSVISKKDKKPYALKKIISNKLKQIGEFTKEFELVHLCNHENIMKVYSYCIRILDPTTYALYVLMELAECDWDKEIKKKLKQRKNYSEKELINILYQLASGLLYIQEKYKISHRDIKPQNVLVFANGKYKLADFGEAKEAKVSRQINTLRGTELYMSPALYDGLKNEKNDVTHNPFKSDVFSLGFCFVYASALNFNLLYEVRDILDNRTINVILHKFLNKFYSEKFIQLLASMLEIDESKRYDFNNIKKYIENNYKDIIDKDN